MYQVFDNNKPAQYPAHKVHPSWKQSKFNSFIEALNYAHKWLGNMSPGRILKLNDPYDYSGCGDILEIRRVA
jgi:hypothetical protein